MTASILVVIPFYKPNFFEKLLTALSDQSDTEFKVVVANDASDPIAEEICGKFSRSLDITYHRFDQRLGHSDLAGQWNRSVALIRGYDWIWVIPDDDLPSSRCIEEIRKATIEANEVGANVIHIPGVTIDEFDNFLTHRHRSDPIMQSFEFYMNQLRGHANGMSLANAVYRRTAFESAGQFKSFPKGWGSDHATTLAVAAGGPIVTVPTAWLGFRMSGINISSQTDDVNEKLQARIEFAAWLADLGPGWYGQEAASQLLRWFYLKGEYYVIRIWPFSISLAFGLYDLADICGVRLNAGQKAGIILRGCRSACSRLVGNARGQEAS